MAPLRSHRGTRGGPRAHDPRRWRASEAVDAVGICLTRRLGGVARVAVFRSAAGSIADQLRHRLGAACLGHPPGRGTSALPGRDGGTPLSVSEHALCSGVAHAPPHPRRGAPRGLNRSPRVFRSRGGAAEGHGGRLEGRWGRALNRAARRPAGRPRPLRRPSQRPRTRSWAGAGANACLEPPLPGASGVQRAQNPIKHAMARHLSALPSRVHMHAPTLGARALHGAARASTAGGRAAVDGRLARDRASGAKGARPQSNFAKFLLPIYSISLSPNHLAAQIITD